MSDDACTLDGVASALLWLRSGAGRCKCLTPTRVPEQRAPPEATSASPAPAHQSDPAQPGPADEVIPLGDPFILSVTAEGAAQQLSEQRGGDFDEQLVATTAASLRQAASGDQLEEVRRATAAAVRALHGIVAALLAVIEGAAAKAADAGWPADAMPSVTEVVAARSASADDDVTLRERLSFKLTGMSQTTRNGTEAPVPPLGALRIRPVPARCTRDETAPQSWTSFRTYCLRWWNFGLQWAGTVKGMRQSRVQTHLS